MRVAIDGGTWGNQRGYGRYTRELVAALAHRQRHHYVLVLDDGTRRAAGALPEGVAAHVVPLGRAPSDGASADGWRSPGDMWRMARALTAVDADIVFFPSVYTFVPLLRRVPAVVAIHDVIAERWPQLVFANPRARLFWNLKVRAARWQATRILTVSEHASRGIQEVFSEPASRIRVSGEAPATMFRPVLDAGRIRRVISTCGIDPDAEVIAYVGGVSPHKNLPALVRVFTRLVAAQPGRALRLLIVGDYAGDNFLSSYPEVRRLVDAACMDSVRFTGRLSDDDLVAVLSGARAVVLPSFDEGFGLPAVEAAACGAAVVVTRESAMPEVLGDAALYIDPADDDSLWAALVRLLDDPVLRAQLGERAGERARALTWDAAAARVEAVFDECAAGVVQP